MATLAELQEHRAALVAARASSVREVKDSTGESVVYCSDAEMAKAISFIDAEIQAMQRGPLQRVVFPSYSKGL